MAEAPPQIPTPETPPREPGEFALRALLTAICALAVLPIWTPRWLGLFDWGAWLHQAALIADWQRQPLYAQSFERLPWPTPAWLVPNLLSALGYALDIDTAGRWLLTVCTVAVPWSALLLARVAGHSSWLALGAAAWIWHQDVALGHLPSVVALPIWLLLLAAQLRSIQRQSAWWLVALGAGSAVLVVTHPAPWFSVCVGMPLIGLLVRAGAARRPLPVALGWFAAEQAVLLAPVLLLLPWWRDRVALAGTARFGWDSNLPVANLRQLVDRLFDVFSPESAELHSLGDLLVNRAGDMVSFLWLFGLGLWVLASIRYARAPAESSQPARIGGAYLGWCVAFLIIGYFAFPVILRSPFWISGINVRLSSVLGIVAVIALPLQPMRPPADAKFRTWLGTAALFVAAVWMPLSVWRAQTLMDAELGDMRGAFAQLPQGKKVLVLRETAESRWHRYRVFHELQRWYPIWRGGLIGGGFPDADLLPVRWKLGKSLPIAPGEDHNQFRWRQDGRWYDYVAVWRSPFHSAPSFESQLSGLVRTWQRGGWTLWRNPAPAPWPDVEAVALPAAATPADLNEPPGRSGYIGAGLLDDWLRNAGLPAMPPADVGDYARAVRVLRWRLQWRDAVVAPPRSPAEPDPNGKPLGRPRGGPPK